VCTVKKLLTATIAALAMLATVPTAQAAQFSTSPGTCFDGSESCIDIHMQGEIIKGDYDQWKKAVAKVPKGKATIYLDSGGGLTNEAFSIAYDIQRQRRYFALPRINFFDRKRKGLIFYAPPRMAKIDMANSRFAVCMIGGEAFSVEDKKTGGRLGYYRTQAEAEKARDAFSRLYKNEIEMAKRSSGAGPARSVNIE